MEKNKEEQKEKTTAPDFSGAVKRMDKIVVSWYCPLDSNSGNDTILLNTWCLASKIADKNQDTMGIDVRCNPPVIKYNPNFINALSDQQLEYVMVSECFKIMLRHCSSRLLSPHQISALSSSITVNPMLKGNNNFKEMDESFIVQPKNFGLKDNQYFEEYFRNLNDMADKTNETIKQIWNSMTQEQKDKMMQDAKDNMEKQMQNQQQQDQDFKEYDNKDQAFKDYFDPNGTSSQGWGKNEMFDADVKQMINDNKNSAKGWGKYTGQFMSEIVAANTAKISYKDVVKRFNHSVMCEETRLSRMKVNRRYDLDSPGNQRKYRTKVIFAVDVSGSMSDEDLKEGFAVINSICRHAEIEYILFDTEIKMIEKKFRKAKKNFKVNGRGGTDTNCVFEYADKNNKDGVVIFTDGEFAAPKKPKCKVLWLLTTKEKSIPVDWGFKAHLQRYEG